MSELKNKLKSTTTEIETGTHKKSEGQLPRHHGAHAMQGPSTSHDVASTSGVRKPLAMPGSGVSTKAERKRVGEPKRDFPGTSEGKPGLQLAAPGGARADARAPPPPTPTAFTRPDDRPPPSAAIAKHRKAAMRILKRSALTPDLCSRALPCHVEEIRSEIAWAMTIVPDYQLPVLGEPPAAEKRNRSMEVAQNKSKRARTQGPTFAEVAKNRILLGVLDENQEDELALRAHWKWVKAELANICVSVLREHPGPPPICRDAGWFQGNVKIVACDDERSAGMYKKAMAMLGEVYPGAMLRAVDFKDIPSRPRARAWIPAKPTEPERVLEIIRLFNPELPSHNWKVVRLEHSTKSTRQAVLLLNKESLPLLEKTGGVINYGFDTAKIRVYTNDVNAARGNEVEPEADNSEDEVDEEPNQANPMDDLAGGYASSTSSLGVDHIFRQYTEEELMSDDDEANSTVVEGVGRCGQDGSRPPD
ncbi:uncharacterized protein LOC118735078 [Rhagoletis pomonella]|uniref:uncharacterized protein LOC118735078 n=1 Tax=Rhagoletis pomonella TaxID=28610 RepID=UPI0017877039|nr:uncharacterized protein LOC118735078 [Rhagoletis pomonella]